jgi:hypothetical protein
MRTVHMLDKIRYFLFNRIKDLFYHILDLLYHEFYL